MHPQYSKTMESGKAAQPRFASRMTAKATASNCVSEVGQTITLCRLLGWAFGPRKLMKNCHADFIATHERPRD
jgi:hypothetical protein